MMRRCAVTPLAPSVRSPGPANINSVILTDSTKVALNTLVTSVTLLSKLQAFAARTDIKGAIVDVAGDARVNTLKIQAAAHTDCPYATNLVAEEIKTIVDSYRGIQNPGLRYVVIVGNDGAIPFFRYPDETLIGQESNYDPPVQSDHAYLACRRPSCTSTSATQARIIEKTRSIPPAPRCRMRRKSSTPTVVTSTGNSKHISSV